MEITANVKHNTSQYKNHGLSMVYIYIYEMHLERYRIAESQCGFFMASPSFHFQPGWWGIGFEELEATLGIFHVATHLDSCPVGI